MTERLNCTELPELQSGNGEWIQKGSQMGRLTLSSSLITSTFSLLAEPTVTVYPAKTQPLQHHDLLVCSLNVFYPGHIEVRWFQNGHDEEAGVISTGLIQNGDWTFQTRGLHLPSGSPQPDEPSHSGMEWEALWSHYFFTHQRRGLLTLECQVSPLPAAYFHLLYFLLSFSLGY